MSILRTPVDGYMQDPEKAYETPRVSPYRLAAHLGSAFLIYSTLLWTSLSLASPETGVLVGRFLGAARLRTWALPLTALIAVTGMSGDTAQILFKLLRLVKSLGPELIESFADSHSYPILEHDHPI